MFGARGCGIECSICALFFAWSGSTKGEAVVSPGAHIRFLID
jgi:hypothetical protein